MFLIHVHSRLRCPKKTASAELVPSERAAGVPDAGVRRVPHAQAAQPRPIRQVDVLVDHEEALVEPAERLERVAADHERGAARAEHFTRRGTRRGRRAVAVLERGARAQIAVAGAVDRRRIVQEHDTRRDQRELRMRDRRVPEPREPRRLDHRVVVEKRQPLARRGARAGVVAGGRSRGWRPSRQAEPLGYDGSRQRNRAVGRTIIDDERLIRRRTDLRRDRIQAARKPSRAVVVEDDHRDGRRHGSSLNLLAGLTV